jgi:hypothetical protein
MSNPEDDEAARSELCDVSTRSNRIAFEQGIAAEVSIFRSMNHHHAAPAKKLHDLIDL